MDAPPMLRSLHWVLPLVLLSTAARAADPDPRTLYALDTRESSRSVKSGQRGRFVLELSPKDGAYLSPATPFRLELTGDRIDIDARPLRLQDASRSPASDPPDAKVRFEVPFVAGAKGEGSVSASVTFFICTATLCLRQVRTVRADVTVD